VSRELHPDDRRMRVLSASAAGVEHHEEQIAPVLDAAVEALAELSDDELEVVTRALGLVWAAKQAAAEATPDPPREEVTDGYTRALLM
jgi:hypothetical protein